MLRYKTKELVEMFDDIREALRAADEGTVTFMVEEQQKEIEEQRRELHNQKKVLTEQEAQITEQKAQLTQQKAQLQSVQKENEHLKELLHRANIKVD